MRSLDLVLKAVQNILAVLHDITTDILQTVKYTTLTSYGMIRKLQKDEENRHTLAESQGRMMQELFFPMAKCTMQRLVCCQTISGIPHRRFILEALQEAVPEKFREESWKMEKSAALQQDQMFKALADCMRVELPEEMISRHKRVRMRSAMKAASRNVRL